MEVFREDPGLQKRARAIVTKKTVVVPTPKKLIAARWLEKNDSSAVSYQTSMVASSPGDANASFCSPDNEDPPEIRMHAMLLLELTQPHLRHSLAPDLLPAPNDGTISLSNKKKINNNKNSANPMTLHDELTQAATHNLRKRPPSASSSSGSSSDLFSSPASPSSLGTSSTSCTSASSSGSTTPTCSPYSSPPASPVMSYPSSSTSYLEPDFYEDDEEDDDEDDDDDEYEEDVQVHKAFGNGGKKQSFVTSDSKKNKNKKNAKSSSSFSSSLLRRKKKPQQSKEKSNNSTTTSSWTEEDKQRIKRKAAQIMSDNSDVDHHDQESDLMVEGGDRSADESSSPSSYSKKKNSAPPSKKPRRNRKLTISIGDGGIELLKTSGGWKPRQRRRPLERKRANPEQVAILEEIYSHGPFPSPRVVRKAAQQLRMREQKVKNWFQNKRAKDRRQKEDHPSSLMATAKQL
ncbi:FACT complex subunit [Balamuthia mandrillaris]